MKSNIYRMMSFGLAVLVLLTSFDYSVDMHFCQDHLKSFSLLGHAEKCYKGEPAKQGCIHSSDQQQSQISKKPCCSDKTLHAKLSQNQVAPAQTSLTTTTLNLTAFVSQLPTMLTVNTWRNQESKWHFKPPSPPEDLLSLLQVFRL